MQTRAAVVPAVLLLMACGQPASPVASSSTAPSSPVAGATKTQIATQTPTPTAGSTVSANGQPVRFGCQPAPGNDPLVLALAGGTEAYLTVLDVANPTQPKSTCDIRPTAGGRFLSNGKVAFWTRDQQLGVADLQADAVTMTGRVSHIIDGGVFSLDGSAFAYRSTDAGGTMTVYVHYTDGSERPLLSRPPVGGHGGPVGGPTSELSFSPDGRHILTYDLFITPDDPTPHLVVFSLTGAVEMKGDYSMGAWSPSGTSLTYLRPSQPGRFDGGAVYDWTPGVADGQLFADVPSYDWPTWVAGAPIYFTAYDGSGYPHLWVIGRSGMSQLSTTPTSHPFVVGGYVWTDQQQPCQCGPGGNSAPTGKVIARNIASGVETVIDLPQPAFTGDPIFNLLDYRGP
ncbi:MAG TPA: hypothetical protein VJT78_09475 [Candidatus Dormibacteraeota bacterium]|nr:hypothetical protein [Candidatus Dormibacteraeota bacterium]